MPRTKNVRKVAIRILAVVLALAASVIVVSAYYSSRVYLYNGEDGQKQIFRVGMELNTFFDILDTEAVAENTKLGIACTDLAAVTENDPSHYTEENDIYVNNTTKLSVMKITDGDDVTYEYVFNPDAEWGSASNPYVISRITHLQNLYVLQNIGYFKTLCFKDDSAKSEANLPFFLISTNEGKPAVIDGTGMNFEYIGSDTYPFVGYVGGAFDTTATATVNGQTSTQSVIYNLVVNGNGNAVDIGLFGHVGYIGDETDVTDGSFPGVASTIRDFLLYDVRVKVREKTAWTALVDKVAHLFSFSSYDDATASEFPHETHHVGILAGHADYATIEYISIYYSNDNVAAIDVDLKKTSENGVSANFSSVSGVLGYIKSLNATKADGRVGTDGNGTEDVIMSGGGAGTGGGLESGTGRGYVTAADIYSTYGDSGKIVKVVKAQTDGSETAHYGLLVQYHAEAFTYTKESGTLLNPGGTSAETHLTLTDGTPVGMADDGSYVSTYSSSKSFAGITEVQSETWQNYVVHDLTKATGAADEYYYINSVGNTVYASQSEVERAGVSLRFAAKLDTETGTFDELCTQYERDRIGSSVTGLTQTTGRYYFYDGVFTFSLSDQTDSIEETWKNGSDAKITVGGTSDGDWTQDESGLPNSVVAFLKPVTSEDQLHTTKEIFIAYKEGDSYHIVTLAGNSSYNAGQGDNAVTTPKTTLNAVSSTLKNQIKASLDSNSLTLEGTSVSTAEQLAASWDDILVLDLGSSQSGLTLDQLRTAYQIKVDYEQVDPLSGIYEEDGTTEATSALINNAKATVNIAGTYYAIDCASGVITPAYTEGGVTTYPYGEDFTLFTLVGSTTVNMSSLLSAISAQDGIYYTADSATQVDTVSPSYLKLKGTPTTADINEIRNAINALNHNVYSLDDVSVETVDGVSYFVLNSATPLDLSAAQAVIDAYNGKYYDYINVSPVSGSGTSSFFSVYDYSKNISIGNIWSAIATFNGNYYRDDGTTVLDSQLKTSLLSFSEGSGYTETKNRTYDEFFYFNTRRTTTKIYYEFFKVSNNTVSGTLKYQTTSLFATQAEEAVSELLGTTQVKNGVTYCTYNSETLPVLYEYNGNYYTTWKRNTSNSYVFDGGTAADVDKSTLQLTVSHTQTFNFIYKSITGNGVVYTWNGLTTACTNVTRQGSATVANTAKWDDNTVFGQDYDLYQCDQGTDAIMIVRYVYDGIILQTLSGGGVSYSLIDGTGQKIADITGSIDAVSDTTLTVDGITYQIYKSGNNKLGVRVAKISVDGYLTTVSTGKGFTYAAVNGSGDTVGSISATMTDTGNTLTLGGKTYAVYLCDGHLGIQVARMQYEGVLVKDSTGSGVQRKVLGTDGTRLSYFSGTPKNTANHITTASGVTYEIRRTNEGDFGVYLFHISIDGVVIQTQTASGVTYSFMNKNGTVTSDTVGHDFFDTESVITVDGVAQHLYMANGKVFFRVANIALDGYVLMSVTSTGTSHTFNGDNTKPMSEPQQLIAEQNGTTYLGVIPLSNGSVTKNYNLYLSDGKLCIRLIHNEIGQQYLYRFFHTSNVENDPYYLRIMKRSYTMGTPKYGMIVSTDSNLENRSQFGTTLVPCTSITDSVDCTVIINGDGTAYLQYTVSGTTRYLAYSTSGGYFASSSNIETASKLYLFTAEGTHDSCVGKRIVPISGTGVGSYDADQYVLWPNNVYDKSRDVTVDNGDGTTSTTNETSIYNPANGFIKDTSYTIKNLSSLGWKDKNSNDPNLDYVFSLGSGISNVTMLNLWGGNSGTTFGADNYVKAPIGTTGEEAYIPTGCVAFRVNQAGTNKIRVIVAVPISEFYYGETGNTLDYTEDYAFCMWKVEEANSATTYSISIDNCVCAFELPRSTPYDPYDTIGGYLVGSEANDTNSVKKYVEITMGGNTYRAYLNGDQVLVAYEFSADEEGVYLLGSTKECRIVYFSADSTASSGNDGVVSSKKIGTIDFVYDNGDYTVSGTGTVTGTAGDKILTVRDINLEVAEDHSQYYYASLALLYTDNFIKVTTDEDAVNGFPNVNDFVVYVRRVSTHGTNETTIVWQVSSYGEASESDAGYLRFEPYANESTSDALVRKENGLLERESN